MKVPLHPGTHLDDMKAMKRLHDIWVTANPIKRQAIISDIFLEIESFSECYNVEVVFDDDEEEA